MSTEQRIKGIENDTQLLWQEVRDLRARFSGNWEATLGVVLRPPGDVAVTDGRVIAPETADGANLGTVDKPFDTVFASNFTNPGGGPIIATEIADQDGGANIEAARSATANMLLALDANGDFPLSTLDNYARGYFLRGGASDWEAVSGKTAGFILQGNGTDLVSAAFDWDTISAATGADMVHSHASDGEGGQISHANLTSVTADQHHVGFIGLEDNAGTAVEPAADDRIQLIQGGVITITAGTNQVIISSPSFATPSIVLGSAAAAGSASSFIRSDATIAAFDATVPMTIQPDASAATGSAAYAARRDHTHAIACAAPGDQAIGDTAAEGSSTSFARADHTHGMPSFAIPTVTLGTAAAAGSAVTLLRSNCTIAAFDATVPTTIQPDTSAATGSAAYAARRDHTHAITCDAPTTDISVSSVNAEGSGNNFARATHTHAITTSNNPGAAAAILASSAAGYLTLVRLNTDTLADRSGGDLSIAPAGDIILNPAGVQIRVAASHTLQSNNYVSQTTGWGISYPGGGDFRYLFTDELHAKAFICDLEQALAGGQIIPKSVGVVATDFTLPAAGAAGTLWVEDLPGAPNMAVFQSGDVIGLRQFSRVAGGLTIADAWGVVTAYADGSGENEGLQSWTFTRSTGSRAGSATGTISAKTHALDYGVSGNGFYEVNSVDGLWAENSPYAQIVTWATHPYDGKTVRVRLGNLKGITAEAEYGLYAGEGVTAGDSYLRLTDQHFELHNLELALYDDGNVQRIGMDPGAGSSDKLMWAGPSNTDPRFVVYGDGTTWLSTLAISEDLGQMLFSQADGLLLLGPGCAIMPTSWTSMRGYTATLSGTFHQGAGRWPETKACFTEVSTTNRITDPIFGYGDLSEWDNYGTATRTRETTGAILYGVAAAKVVTAGPPGGISQTYTTSTGGSWTASAYIYIESFTMGAIGVLCTVHYTDATYDNAWAGVDTSKLLCWQRVSTTVAADAGKTVDYVRIDVYCANTATFRVDGVQLENRGCPTSLCWGDAGYGYSWSGTPHASASSRAANYINLDAYVGLISGLNTITHSVWIQTQYDASDASWPSDTNSAVILAYRGADSNNYMSLAYDPNTSDRFRLYINGTYIQETGQTFQAGDWLHLVVTLDFTNDSYNLYLNGALIASDTTSRTAPIGLVDWVLGTAYNGGSAYYGGWIYGEYAVFGRVLTADEVAALYALGRPLADAGALRRPGIYILDGEVDLRTAQTGARVQFDVSGIRAYDSSSNQRVQILNDGSGWFGSSTAFTWTAAGAVTATGITVQSAAGGARVELTPTQIAAYDATTQRAKISADGSGWLGASTTLAWTTAGVLTLAGWIVDSSKIYQANAHLNSSGYVSFGTTPPTSYGNNVGAWLGYSSGAKMSLYADTNNYLQWDGSKLLVKAANFTLDSSGNITASGGTIGGWTLSSTEIRNSGSTVKLRSAGNLAFGSTPPTSYNSGTGIFIDSTGLFALSSGTYQVKIDTTDGKLYAGGGQIWLDGSGINIDGGSGAEAIFWRSGGNIKAWMHAAYTSGTGTTMTLYPYAAGVAEISKVILDADSLHNSRATLTVQSSFGFNFDIESNRIFDIASTYFRSYVDGRIDGGLYVGGVGTDPDADEIWLDRLVRFMAEISDPAAPSSNQAKLYVRDNGGGKTQLCVRFATGAVQVLATEP